MVSTWCSDFEQQGKYKPKRIPSRGVARIQDSKIGPASWKRERANERAASTPSFLSSFFCRQAERATGTGSQAETNARNPERVPIATHTHAHTHTRNRNEIRIQARTLTNTIAMANLTPVKMKQGSFGKLRWSNFHLAVVLRSVQDVPCFDVDAVSYR